MYIELYFPKSLYGEVLRRARADLQAAVEGRNHLSTRLETLDKEIVRLNRLLGDVLSCMDKSKKQDSPLFAPSRTRGVRKPRSYVSNL